MMARSVLLSVLCVASLASAEGLSEALTLLADARFEDARQQAAGWLRSGSAKDPRETAELHFVIARASAALGDVGEAKRSFGRALELEPGLHLPVGTSPKLLSPYDAARRALGGRALTISPSGTRSGERAAVTVKIIGDALQLFSHGTVHRGADTVALAPTDPPQATISCPAKVPCSYRVSLFDLSGNPLLEVGTELLVDGGEVLPPPVIVRPFTKYLPWLLGAAAAVGAGIMAWQTAAADARVRSTLAAPGDSTYGATAGEARTRDALLVGAISASVVSGGALLVGVFVW